MTSPKLMALAALTALLVAVATSACSSTTSAAGPETPGPGTSVPDLGDDPYSSGDDSSERGEAFADDQGPARPAGGGGTGRLQVKVVASGEAAGGQVRILSTSEDLGLVAEGPSGRTYDVPAGSYHVDVVLEDALDRPEKRIRDVRVEAGRTAVAEAVFVVGQVKLTPVQGRRPVGKEIRWRYNGGGDWFEQGSEVGQEVVLSAGRYDAEVMVQKRAVTIQDIQVYEGRRTISPEVSYR